MAENKPTAAKPQGEESFLSPLAGLEWLKPAADSQSEACRRMLDFSAARLREQADFLQKLAGCRTLPDLVQRQTEFFEKAWASYAGEATQGFEQAAKLWTGSPR